VARAPAIADSARRPAQIVRFVAREVPARGFRRYRVVPGDIPTACACVARADRLESPAFMLAVAPDGAGIASIHDRVAGSEWIRAGEFALGEVVYEAIPGPFGREKLCGWSGIRRDCPFTRTPLRFGTPEPLALPYGAGLRLVARDLPGSLRALTLEVVVYDALPRVDLRYRLEKVPNIEAEALYVAFPLAGGSLPAVWLDVPGAVMRPGLDQVPGTATDWHGLQHYFAVSGPDRTTVVASPDIPLVQVNGINTGKWQETLPPHNGLVMSWVFNNYWFTNFPAAQGGVLEWRYSLCAMPGPFDAGKATRFAAAVRRPPAAVVIPPPSTGGTIL
jgi:hypothetical protein